MVYFGYRQKEIVTAVSGGRQIHFLTCQRRSKQTTYLKYIMVSFIVKSVCTCYNERKSQTKEEHVSDTK